MSNFKQAKEHFNNLTSNWEYEEQKHYEENPSDDHIFHSLLDLSIWVKENHTMKENL